MAILSGIEQKDRQFEWMTGACHFAYLLYLPQSLEATYTALYSL